MILECLIAGPDIEIDGVPIPPDAVSAKLPVPLLREHRGKAVGEVYQLVRTSRGLIAFCETSIPVADYTHVSPSLRIHTNKRMTLLEVSLVRQPKSQNTLILGRMKGDLAREYTRSIAEGHDLLIKRISLLQELVRTIHATS